MFLLYYDEFLQISDGALLFSLTVFLRADCYYVITELLLHYYRLPCFLCISVAFLALIYKYMRAHTHTYKLRFMENNFLL